MKIQIKFSRLRALILLSKLFFLIKEHFTILKMRNVTYFKRKLKCVRYDLILNLIKEKVIQYE